MAKWEVSSLNSAAQTLTLAIADSNSGVMVNLAMRNCREDGGFDLLVIVLVIKDVVGLMGTKARDDEMNRVVVTKI